MTFESSNITVYAAWGYDRNNDGTADVSQTWHTITATAGENGAITPNGNVSVLSGADQAFTITPDDGYAVDTITVDVDAYTNNGSTTVPGEGNSWTSYTFSNVTGDHSISVTFGVDTNDNDVPDNRETTHTLTYNGNAQSGGNVTNLPDASTGNLSGAEVTLSSTEPSHSDVDGTAVEFIGWTAAQTDEIFDKGGTAPTTITEVTFESSNITVYAAWGYDRNNDGTADVSQTWHTITATAGENGAITPNGNVSVLSGADQAFTITPDDGYAVDTITVDVDAYTNNGSTTVPGEGNSWTSYTFSNVTGDHSISVTFGVDTNGNGVPDANETTHTLTYDGNAQSDGEVSGLPESESGKLPGAEVTLSSTKPSHSEVDGTAVEFIGWTAAQTDEIFDKGGTAPTTITEVTFESSNITVYAAWGYDRNNDGTADVSQTWHTITATAGENGAITPNGNVSVLSGADQAFTITPDDGYAVDTITVDVDAYTNNGSTTVPGEGNSWTSYTFSNVTGDHSISVTFGVDTNGNGVPDANETTHTLTYDGNAQSDGEVSGLPESESGKLPGAEVTLSSTKPSHSEVDGTAVEFIGWTAAQTDEIFDKGGTAPTTITEVTFESSNITVYAAWGYDRNNDGTADVSQTWHTITATAGENGAITPNGNVSVLSGADQAFTITPDDGYAVDTITVDVDAYTNNGSTTVPGEGNSWTSYTFSNVTGDHSISVTFGVDTNDNDVPDNRETTHTLTYNGNAQSGGNVTNLPDASTGNLSGAEVTLSSTEPSHSDVDGTAVEFIGWTAAQTDEIFDKGGTAPTTITEVTFESSNITVYAAWGYDRNNDGTADVSQTWHTITATAGENGAITPNGNVSVLSGADQAFTITPDDGYAVDTITVDVDAYTNNGSTTVPGEGNSWTSYTFSNVTGDHSISVTFGVDTNGNGVPDANETTHTLTYDGNAQSDGEVSGLPESESGKLPGAEVTLSSTKPSHSEVDGTAVEFIGWTAAQTDEIFDKGGTAPTTITEVTFESSNITVYAAWGYDRNNDGTADVSQTWHTITATAGENGTITPNGNVSVLSGADQAFTITPDRGYHISDVKVDGKSVGAVSTYTFENVTGNHTIMATFAKDSGGNVGGGVTRYIITAEAGDGGSISPSGKVSVMRGNDKTFRITPDDGYEIADVIVDGESVGSVSTYTFENVKAKHTIEVVFEETIPVADPDNTGVSDWLNTEDHNAYLSGYPGGLFGPNNNMTRAEVAQMFYNLLLDKDVTITAKFDDVPADAWYADAVNTLASLGMINGVGDNLFQPERSITRAEFTTIAMRFTDGALDGENIFPDVNPDDWFYDYVVGSIQYGWINGYPDGTFHPNATITRAEVTTITNRMLGRSADEAFVDDNQASLVKFSDITDNHWAYYQVMEAANAHDYTKTGGVEDWIKLH